MYCIILIARTQGYTAKFKMASSKCAILDLAASRLPQRRHLVSLGDVHALTVNALVRTTCNQTFVNHDALQTAVQPPLTIDINITR